MNIAHFQSEFSSKILAFNSVFSKLKALPSLVRKLAKPDNSGCKRNKQSVQKLWHYLTSLNSQKIKIQFLIILVNFPISNLMVPENYKGIIISSINENIECLFQITGNEITN